MTLSKELNKRYGGLFESESEDDEQGTNRNKGGFAKYGWTITIRHLVKELNLKPSEVYEMHIHEFFLYWCNFFKAEKNRNGTTVRIAKENEK